MEYFSSETMKMEANDHTYVLPFMNSSRYHIHLYV